MQVPDLTSRPVPVARVEQALIAVAVAHAGGQICSIDRYSSRPDPPAVRYGAAIGFRDGWKLFLSCMLGLHECREDTDEDMLLVRMGLPGAADDLARTVYDKVRPTAPVVAAAGG